MTKHFFLTFLFLLPFFGYTQHIDNYHKLKSDSLPKFELYEKDFFSATQYILKKPEKSGSVEFKSALKIIDYWKDKDTGVNIPIFGKFYESLTPKTNQRYLYMVAMINYILDQKINHDKVIKCVKIEGQKFSEQSDVKEVQLEGAKIFLEFAENEHSNIKLNKQSKKYSKAYRKDELDNVFFN